jgi:predicted site-specific integrase-resolvase
VTVPAYVDLDRLCQELCISERTVDVWTTKGLLPKPRKHAHKRLWKWAEVEKYLDGKAKVEAPRSAEDITNATKKALSEAF